MGLSATVNILRLTGSVTGCSETERERWSQHDEPPDRVSGRAVGEAGASPARHGLWRGSYVRPHSTQNNLYLLGYAASNPTKGKL